MMKRIFLPFQKIKIRTKMILIVTGVVFLCVGPLSLIILYRNQAILLDKTFEVCLNLGDNISNLATEELLINETFDATSTALSRLKTSQLSGLLDAYVVNIDGRYVAEINENHLGKPVPRNELDYYFSLKKLDFKEVESPSGSILRFTYPIFIEYRDKKIRVGAAIFEFDKEEVYAPVVQTRTTIILGASILFFIGIIIAVYSAIFFSRPIQELTAGAKLIGSGDLSHRISLQNQDEIGELANTFNRMTSQIQDFTQNLESKVEQRTEELNQSLKVVQDLKERQDGDYYLTSLLLQPLQPNNNNSKTVKTEFLIDQKKKFSFRKWKSEIGGDICITDTISLQDQEYTVFINGDAMGKSIQGAGGALVLGVVFNAGLMRSRITKNQKVYPEVWLKERFLDLQNVFRSFEGSMFISVCMGLVEAKTGVMYYINAEHPWTVLLRDGKASFLEEELTIRKLGTPDIEEKFFVRMFQLMPDDVVITGSDGRDDFAQEEDDPGYETINTDEMQFLYRVEEAGGDLEGIFKGIKSKGFLIDDLSLLKISYDPDISEAKFFPTPELPSGLTDTHQLLSGGNTEEAIQSIEELFKENPNFSDLLKLLGKLYFETKEYSRAVECLNQFIDINPANNESVYLLSLSYKNLNLMNEAADVGERLYLREPLDFNNLISLAEIYFELGVYRRGEFLIQKALESNPDDQVALQIQTKIESLKNTLTPEEIQKVPKPLVEIRSLTSVIESADNLYAEKKYKEALSEYKEALKRSRENPFLLFRTANCLSLLERMEEAIEFYSTSLALVPNNHHARNNLGSIFFRLQRYSEARNEWEIALQMKPDFKTARINLDKLEKFIQENLIQVES